jgi:hypothetical protein
MNFLKMKLAFNRVHLFEIEDQSWCPTFLRNGVTDFLQHIVQVFPLYRSIVPRLGRALNTSDQNHILDLCSGGTGPWLSLSKDLSKEKNRHSLAITLTDLYPNHSAFTNAQAQLPRNLSFLNIPVDAMHVPVELTGFRTLFSSFHHLNPHQAQALLQNAVDAKSGIAIFESTQRHPLSLAYMLFTPLFVIINTPFIRPFRWSRLFWTYIIPLIPFIVMFDGIVSCLRTYSTDELKTMTGNLTAPDYHWEIGLDRIGNLPIGVTYLIGIPVKPI